MGYVEDQMQAMQAAGITCPDCLRALRAMFDEQATVQQCRDAWTGLVPDYWLDAAGLYQRCYEISDRRFEVSFGMVNDVLCARFDTTFAGNEFAACVPVLDENGNPHYPPRIVGALLLLAHQTLARLGGLLPVGHHSVPCPTKSN